MALNSSGFTTTSGGVRRSGADSVATCIVIEEARARRVRVIPAVNKLGTMGLIPVGPEGAKKQVPLALGRRRGDGFMH